MLVRNNETVNYYALWSAGRTRLRFAMQLSLLVTWNNRIRETGDNVLRYFEQGEASGKLESSRAKPNETEPLVGISRDIDLCEK